MMLRIPMPDMYTVQQLAQITTRDGHIEAYWWRECRKAVLEYNGEWYLVNDGYITDAVAELLGVKESTMKVARLVQFDTDSTPREVQDDQEMNGLLECAWSDYGSDCMAFQAEFDYPEPRD